jgi:MOSC domain-containing protein YiiM
VEDEMIVESVNVGHRQAITAKSGWSGIFKSAQPGSVFVSTLGLVGDVIVDQDSHGGFEQAVYVYTRPDLDWWAKELGRDLAPGTFGENLLLSAGESAAFCIGDRLALGEVLLEITSHRTPCVTLAARMDDRKFVRHFTKARRPGFYCRVLAEGLVSAGMTAVITPFDGECLSVGELADARPYRNLESDLVRRILATPVHAGMRDLLNRYSVEH